MFGNVGVVLANSISEKYKIRKERKKWRKEYNDMLTKKLGENYGEDNDDEDENDEDENDDGDSDGTYEAEKNNAETKRTTGALEDASLGMLEQSLQINNMNIDSETKIEPITQIGPPGNNENDWFPMPPMNMVTNAQEAAQMGQPQFGEERKNDNSDAPPPPPSYNAVITNPDKYSTGEQPVSGYQQQPQYPIVGIPGPDFNDKAPWQSSGQTLQDLIDNRDAIEKEINDIEKKINDINNDIELGNINATEGAAKVKSLMAEAKMKEKRLKRLQQQVIQQQEAMPFWQGTWQAPPAMLYWPTSPQGMPLPTSETPVIPYDPMDDQLMTPYDPMAHLNMMTYDPMTLLNMLPYDPITWQQMTQMINQPGADNPMPQLWSETTTEPTRNNPDNENHVSTTEDTYEDESEVSYNNHVKENNSPYSRTHNAIFDGNQVKRETAENLDEFNLDDLLEKMKKPFLEYLFNGSDEQPKRDAAYKPYDKIIEKLFADIEKCKEAYSESANLYKDDPTCLAYKKTICECIQDWDTAIVNAFNDISNITGKAKDQSENNTYYEEARALMAKFENVIQADAYTGFYIESVKTVLGDTSEDDDDDSPWSLNDKSFKDDGKKYSINVCYVAMARTINNLIEVIKFILGGEDQPVCDEIAALRDLCQQCINLNTPLDTSISNFKRMPDTIQDIRNDKNTVFGDNVSKVNDEAFSNSLSMLSSLIKELNKAKNEKEISIGTHLEKIHSLFCKIPRNTAECKFQNLPNIMTGILTDGDYDSHAKMFR